MSADTRDGRADAARDDPPFHVGLYPTSLIDAVARAQERIRIVLGGPHMGTTTVLAAIVARTRQCIAVSARRDRDLARRTIAAWAAGQSRPICIDNVEEIIADLDVQQHLIGAQSARSNAVLGGFFSIKRVRNRYRVDAANAHASGESGVLAPTDLWWQKSHVTYLDPWGYPRANRPPWNEQMTDLVIDRLTEELDRLGKEAKRSGDPPRRSGDEVKARLTGRPPRLSHEAVRLAAAALVRVSGGHPMLIGRGYQTLCGWIAGEATEELADLEELLTAALHSVSFDMFREAAEVVQEETPDGFDALLELARSPDRRPQNLPEADLLRASGLVREIRDHGVAVWELVHSQAGPAIRYVAGDRDTTVPERSQSPEPAAPPRVRIRPDPRQPTRGSIERVDDGAILLTLTKTQWKLLWELAKARGQPIAVSVLADEIGTQHAVNPGLQRLRDKLRKVGLENLVYNCHGSGYAIDMSSLEPDKPGK